MAIQFGQKNYGDIVAIKELLGGISDLDIRNRMQKLMMAKDLADKAQVSGVLSKVNLSDPNSVAEGYSNLFGIGTPRAMQAIGVLEKTAPPEEYNAIRTDQGVFVYGRRGGKGGIAPGTEQKQDLMSIVKEDPALNAAYNTLGNTQSTLEARTAAHNMLSNDPRLKGVQFLKPSFREPGLQAAQKTVAGLVGDITASYKSISSFEKTGAFKQYQKIIADPEIQSAAQLTTDPTALASMILAKAFGGNLQQQVTANSIALYMKSKFNLDKSLASLEELDPSRAANLKKKLNVSSLGNPLPPQQPAAINPKDVNSLFQFWGNQETK
jgi:hypothetical protein